MRHSGRSSSLFWLIILCLPGLAWGEPITDYNVAVDFYKKQRWQLAAESCEDFLRKYPDHERAPSARLYLGQALVHLKKYNEAREEFRRFLTVAGNHPDRPLATYRIGECGFLIGDYQTAREDLERFLQQYGTHDLAEWAVVYLGETDLRLKNYDAAAKIFEQSLQRFPNGRLVDDAEFGLAKAYEGLGRVDAAMQVYRRTMSRPDSQRAAEAQFNLGARFFDEGKLTEAAATFNDLAAKHPGSSLVSLAHLNAGYSEFRQEHYAEAMKQFEQAAADPAQRSAAMFWLGMSQKALGNLKDAAATFAKSYDEQPDQAWGERLTLQWGDCELRLGNAEKALELFQQVVTRWPQGELADDALHSAGEAALKAGKLDQAAQLHQQFLQQYSESPLKLVDDLLYARVLLAQGDATNETSAKQKKFEEAIPLLKQVIQLSTLEQTQRYARLQLARAYERLQQEDEVVKEVKALLDSSATSMTAEERADALIVRGNAEFRRANLPEAIADYDAAAQVAQGTEMERTALAGLAAAATRAQDWERVTQTLDRMEQADSSQHTAARAAVAAGDAAFEAKNWGIAESFFRRVTAQPPNPYRVPALSGLAHTAYEKKDFAEAAKLFEELQQAAAEDLVLKSHAAYMHALALRQAGETDAALTAYQSAVDSFAKVSMPTTEGEHAVALNISLSARGGARLARELQKRDQAETLYETAYQQLKKLPAAQQAELDKLINEWADLSYNAQDYARSDELYSLLIKECPDSPLADDAQLILAESLRFGGNPEDSVAAFEKLADSPQSDDFVRQRALVHLLDLAADGGDWERVLQLSERLTTEHPNSAQVAYAMYRRGEALLQQRKFDAAAQVLQELTTKLTANQQSPPAWWLETWLLLAEAQLGQKNYSALETTLNDLRTRAPEAPVLYRADALLGRSLENRAMFDEARAAYTRVIESEAGRGTETAAESQFRIAESYLKQKNPTAALKEYYKVYVGYDAPRFKPAALFQAAECDVALKNLPEAVESYKTLLAEFPESEFAAQARNRLKELESKVPAATSAAP